MLTCSVINLKGGVGKTSVTLGLAGVHAYPAFRVLVIDLDPQANATMCLAPDLNPDTDLTINDVLASNDPGAIVDAIRPTSWAGVDLVAAQLELDARESDPAANATHRLRRSMRGLAGYNLVLIDCRPSVGRLTTNALVASDVALVITDPDRAAIRGISEALRHVDVVVEDLNPQLRLAGLIVNRSNERKSEHAYRLTEIRDTYGADLWAPPVPDRTVVAQAYGAGVPVQQIGGRAADEVAAIYRTHLDHLMRSDDRPATQESTDGQA